jgi:hypothetical protein
MSLLVATAAAVALGTVAALAAADALGGTGAVGDGEQLARMPAPTAPTPAAPAPTSSRLRLTL